MRCVGDGPCSILARSSSFLPSHGRGRVPASHVHKGASNRGTPSTVPVISSWRVIRGPAAAGSSIAIDFLAHLRRVEVSEGSFSRGMVGRGRAGDAHVLIGKISRTIPRSIDWLVGRSKEEHESVGPRGMGNAVGTELCGNIIHGFAGAECALWSFVVYTRIERTYR